MTYKTKLQLINQNLNNYQMKNFFFTIITLGLISINSYAQVSSYTFSQFNNVYTELTGGNVLGNASTDEQRFVDASVPLGDTVTIGVGLPIGFNFTYNGTIFDVFAINANGWISLGQSSQTPSVNMKSSNYQTPISANSSAPAILQNRVSAFGRNILGRTNSELSYLTLGSSPNRTLVVQWKNYRRLTTSTTDTINFQIRLNETTNRVQFNYGNVIYAGNNSTVQVGIRGQANTDFNNRMSTTSWASTIAGVANNSTVRISSTIVPASGLLFTFTPPIIYQYDAALTGINSPSTPVTIGNNNVTFTLKNLGTDTLHNAIIEWSVNNVLQTPYSFINAIVPQYASNGPDTLGVYNFVNTGTYVIKAWITLPNGNADENNSNDTITKSVYAQAYATIPFFENFENTWVNKNDTNDVASLFWTNTPAFGNSSWRRDDDTTSSPWIEGIGGAYTVTGADNTDHSARFHTWSAFNNSSGVLNLYADFTPTGNKILDFWYINTSGVDSLSIYLSTNAGANFSFIRKLRTTLDWTRYIINIGNSSSVNCVIRFKAVSDYAQTDIGLDQVKIYLQPANEMAAVKWISPVSGCGLTNAEHVTVRVRNDGTFIQNNIPVKYSMNGGVTFVGTENIPGPINPGDSIDYTFISTSDFSFAGNYNCRFVVNLSGDPIALNDSAYATIISSNIISSFPFIENFNNASSSYLILSSNIDANIYYDTIGTQSSYGLRFTGKTTNLWTSGNTTTSAAWGYTSHQATAAACGVDATAVSRLSMKFDIRETTSNNAILTYTWYAVIANGTDTIADLNGVKYFNPSSANDIYSTKYFDLTNYASTNFTLKFVSSCRRDAANSSNAIGDNVFFDNLVLYEPLIINDLGRDTIICEGNTITYNAGAGAGYTYEWTRIPSTDVLGRAQVFTVDTTGTYRVLVTNVLGLTAADTVTVTVNPLPQVFAGNDTVIQYMTTTNLYGYVAPISGNYTYLWTPDTSIVDASLLNPTTDTLYFSTIFTLYATNTNSGCAGTDQVIVSVVGGPLSVTAYINYDTICNGGAVELLGLPSGGSGNYSYNWTCSNGTFNSNVADTLDSPTLSTTYYLSIYDGTDIATDSINVYVRELPLVFLGNDISICSQETITLYAGIAESYLWSTGEITQTVVVDSNDAVNGIADIWVTITSLYGCSNTDNILITFDNCTGIKENYKNETISVYPNPANGMVNIVVSGFNNNAELNIYSLDGQSIYKEIITGNSPIKHDLSYLTKGIYIIRINNANTNLISKLIIQ